VMGTHGRRGLQRLILGSVAEQVLRSTTLPVLLVPLRAHAEPRKT
jgi:nucleotide-binding universal stress UspA family protein